MGLSTEAVDGAKGLSTSCGRDSKGRVYTQKRGAVARSPFRFGLVADYAAAAAITDATFEKIVEMLVATPGMMAPAATATKPAINAYSIRS